MRMDKEIKAKWIKALLSGDYKQTSEKLRRTNGETSYCCLGVLCEIVREDMQVSWAGNRFAGSDFVLSSSVMAHVGGDVELFDKFSSMNDGGNSFEEIVVAIEEVA